MLHLTVFSSLGLALHCCLLTQRLWIWCSVFPLYKNSFQQGEKTMFFSTVSEKKNERKRMWGESKLILNRKVAFHREESSHVKHFPHSAQAATRHCSRNKSKKNSLNIYVDSRNTNLWMRTAKTSNCDFKTNRHQTQHHEHSLWAGAAARWRALCHTENDCEVIPLPSSTSTCGVRFLERKMKKKKRPRKKGC